MDWNAYQTRAAKTSGAKDDAQPNGRVIVAALGLAGEAGELANKLKKEIGHQHPTPLSVYEEELGDVLWYLAELCTAMGLKIGELPADTVSFEYTMPIKTQVAGVALLLKETGILASVLIDAALQNCLTSRHVTTTVGLGKVLTILEQIMDSFGLAVEQVSQANLAKLAKRYPNGFSPEASLNRTS